MNARVLWGFIPSIPYSYIGSNAELDAGGVLHPILNRERVQWVFHSFPTCTLPHSDREPPKSNPVQLIMRHIFARMWYWVTTLMLCRVC